MRTALVTCALLAISSASSTQRTFTLVNQCDKGAFFTLTSGAAGSGCDADSECPPNSSCDPNNHICFWDIPTPASGVFHVTSGGTNSLTWPVLTNDVVWSGNIGFCLEGTCAGSASDCETGKCGMADDGPQTRAEFTISTHGTDFYDITIINGVNIGMAIVPVNSTSAPLAANSNPYWCGSPGASHSPTGSAPSNWTFPVPSPYYKWVLNATEGSCTSDSDCTQPSVCGFASHPNQTPRYTLSCGVLGGYWTDGGVCGGDQTVGAPFDCTQPVSNGPTKTSTLNTYYGCTDGIASCYQPSAGDTCCGCLDWWTVGLPVPPAPATDHCPHANPEWVKLVGLPRLAWLKTGCPACYTFPFDDMSSTFVCSQIVNKINTVDYNIVLCPQA